MTKQLRLGTGAVIGSLALWLCTYAFVYAQRPVVDDAALRAADKRQGIDHELKTVDQLRLH